MKTSTFVFLISSLLVFSTEGLYRVRKYIQRSDQRRSVADDDLDMAAAESIFKEKGVLKQLNSEKLEGPPSKFPFGTEQTKEPNGAPAVEPTLTDLKEKQVEEEENVETLKSSMVGEGIEETTEINESSTTTFSSVHDGETSSGRVFSIVPKWQQPLPSHGRLIAYDFNVNPEYPQFAPRARGLVGIPDGWNLDKTIDKEFQSGFRQVDLKRRS